MPQRRPARHPALGIALILAMAACFGTMDTGVKWLGAYVPVLFILWVRYGTQAVVMAIWLARPGAPGYRSAHPRFQALRGALLLATSAMSFYGVQHMPVAEFTAIGMLTPVVVTLLAALFLNEHVSALRWTLVVGAFAGALIVIRPGSGAFGGAAVFPLLMALSYGAFQVLTSKLAALENPFVTHFHTGLTGTLLLTPLLLLSGLDLPAVVGGAAPWQLAALLAIGLLGTTGHLCLILALGMASTATLMPFVYTQIGFALAAGWLAFRHGPDTWAWVGMGVIAACGAASAWLNVRSAQAGRRPESAVAADTMAD